MIKYSTVSAIYCDRCERKAWSYQGADQQTCLDRAERDGWRTIPAELPFHVPEHLCPACARGAATAG